ncbi:hypothetical protein FNV43_RR03719 [Rhamnella rubrinervis]|uniref:GH18 domain-containing protein n=1 Tax=Rhamnella rubrinervis TaxID=2594499 RepID=A0A8K0HJD5_9ROSA|nr:hypothetical protein FNV43_RR03719 [Rhamnella rubrinervis]
MASRTSPLLIFSIFFFLFHNCAGQTTNVKGVYWFPGSEFPVSSIDSTLFTHIFCAFADLNPTTYQVSISSSNQAQFSTFTQTVQQKNPNVKTLLSIGGGGANTDAFASMASQTSRRKSFIDSSISLARSNNFHDLDLDWEYPDTAAKYTSFGTLLTEWRAAVATESRTSGKAVLLLFRSSNYYSLNYPVQAISNSLDWINAMTYDYYGPGWSPSSTGPPARRLCTVELQIVLGLPFYGYAWRLVNSNNHGLFAPANGAAISADGSIAPAVTKDSWEKSVLNCGTPVLVELYASWCGPCRSKGLLGYFAWHVGADSNWALSQTGLQLCAGQTSNVKGVHWFPGSEFPVSSIDSTLFTHIFCPFADLNSPTYEVTIFHPGAKHFKTSANQTVKVSIFKELCLHVKLSLIQINILTEWRAAIAAESRTSGNEILLLTAAVFRSSNYYSLNYPVQAISNSLDWINAMTYDYYGPRWSPSSTGPPAALYSGSAGQISSDAGIRDWIQSGLSANKIVLGLPFYGYAWRLVNATNHGLFAPANGTALTADGSIGYEDLSRVLK